MNIIQSKTCVSMVLQFNDCLGNDVISKIAFDIIIVLVNLVMSPYLPIRVNFRLNLASESKRFGFASQQFGICRSCGRSVHSS